LEGVGGNWDDCGALEADDEDIVGLDEEDGGDDDDDNDSC